ncbi:MAG: preprotein translocase subunit SecG [Bacteroidetes bacterium]|nr:preprotein translocase subunit SecG [Bacteroidota bacterium]
MMYVVIILIMLVCVFLTFIVWIQNPKGGGIASNFSAGNQIMGVKRTNDFVEKATWGSAIALLVLVLASNLFTGGSAQAEKSILQKEIDAGTIENGYIPKSSLENLNSAGSEETNAEELPDNGGQEQP